jgi:hypothetical protein
MLRTPSLLILLAACSVERPEAQTAPVDAAVARVRAPLPRPPAVAEVCNGLDDDGDGRVDEVCRDTDGDGVHDCRDFEVCDRVDNDGDGLVDEGFDADQDGFADCDETCVVEQTVCWVPGAHRLGRWAKERLCGTRVVETYEKSQETCDGRDNDCDGRVDEGTPDADGDRLCDDRDVELCDGVDNDGDGAADEGFGDSDADGLADCVDVETCDGVDNDGDGRFDEGFPDSDGDDLADCVDTETCDGVDNDGDRAIDEGFSDIDEDGIADCADAESCDGVDNDGDGIADEGYSDADMDGVADCVDTETCDGLDNDGDGLVDDGYPDVDADHRADCIDTETCDGRDNDGDGLADEGYDDSDGDGVADCVDPESCDGLDNDGDGSVDEDFSDVDDDGLADCLDVEVCDGDDNDGDGAVDEGFDLDADGFADCTEECRAELHVCSAADGQTTLEDGSPAVSTWSGHTRWTAQITGASWLWDQEKETNPTRSNVRSFFREICLANDARNMTGTLKVAADNSYKAWLNGTLVGQDPGETNYFAPADTWSVSHALAPCANDLEIEVDNWAQPGGTEWTNPGGVLYCLDVAYDYDKDPEVCNGLDDDCDGHVDEGYPDSDFDGIADCKDVEVCDGVDNDGDGFIDDGFDRGSAYSWSVNGRGGGSDGGGYIESTRLGYDEVTRYLTFSTTIRHRSSWSKTNGFWIAVNAGPNPKGHGELALFYFDASRSFPVLTTYAYNGENADTSWRDGSTAPGTQAADPIASSLADDRWIRTLTSVDDGTRITMTFVVDTVAINDRLPRHRAVWDWTGAQFGSKLGIWYHTAIGVNTSYDAGGWLTNWSVSANGWIDNTDQTTVASAVCAVRR